VPSLLVLSGVTDAADVVLATEGLRPAYLSEDLGGLHVAHPETSPDGSGWRCAGGRAEVVDGELALSASAARLDVVRAACAAAWHHGVRRLDPHGVRRALAAVLR
jgi:hypothetical protein